MGQEMGPPIDQFRTQKAPKTDETLRAVFNTLIQAYDAARQGRITDAKTIRLIARQFETIADSPEASDLFPYDAGRAAAALYNWALDLDMRTRDRASSQVVHTTHDIDLVERLSETPQTTTEVNNVTENTTEKIKPVDRSIHFVDNMQDLAQTDSVERDRQTQKRINEGHGNAMIPEQSPQKEATKRIGDVKVTPATPEEQIEIDQVEPAEIWRAVLEAPELAKKMKSERAKGFK
jgi:hypothetical protein